MLILPAIIVVSIIVILFVLALSVFTIQKGYRYKHTVDPLPPEKSNRKGSEDA